jgi:hypothetical protein
MLLEKLPVPPPFVVCESVVVGFPDVFQQTPRKVTGAPLSSVIIPPDAANVVVTFVTEVVVSVGIRTGFVVKDLSLP